VAYEVAGLRADEHTATIDVEHPTGYFSVSMNVSLEDGVVRVQSSALLRTARLLMRGQVFVPGAIWRDS
jgi:4-oxalomesaconate tautomerase